MIRTIRMGAAALAAGLAMLGAAQAAPVAPAVDYGRDASWVCRHGKEQVCATGLDAMVVTADGRRSRESFVPATDPPIDCFYVYPTISLEPSSYADMAQTPEIDEVTRAQAGRLTSRCRVFAPIYRQITMSGLKHDMAAGEHLDWRGPYADVLAAWRTYLARDNHGRGVVLIGHSQGTILLQQLIAREIDGKPAQKLLVSAFLAGDPSLAVPAGARVGGVFKSVPLCHEAAETGCAYAWGDYLADDASPTRDFGRNPGDGEVAACVNPAAPQGGPGPLVAYLPKPASGAPGDPPWVKVVGQLSGACVADGQGAALRVTILPGPFAERLHAGLQAFMLRSGWGLHRLDLSLPQGNILDVVAAESAHWTGK